MYLNIVKKRALVTGGSRGIGRAIADELKREGCLVDICSRTMGIRFDVLNGDISKLGDEYDILINNVGGATISDTVSTETKDWNQVFDLNITSTFMYQRLTCICIYFAYTCMTICYAFFLYI